LVGSTGSWRGTARAGDAQGTPTQNNISPSILVFEEHAGGSEGSEGADVAGLTSSSLLLSSLELSDAKAYEP